MLQYKTPEPETPKEIINDQEAQVQVEEPTPIKVNPKEEDCEEESKENKKPQRYNLRPHKKKVDYKEEDLRCSEVAADPEIKTKKKK